jgi:hypothetical protein
MTGTSIEALQVECGLQLFYLRCLSQQLKLAAKIDATDGHVAKTVISAHWTDRRRARFARMRLPKFEKVRGYMLSSEYKKAVGPTWASFPPWKARLPAIDTELSQYGPKTEAPNVLAAIW